MGELDQKEIQKELEQTDDSGKDVAESLSQLLETLADEEKTILFSELSEREITHLSVISTVGDEDEVTQNFIDNFMKMKVSKKRRGRKELSDVAQAFASVHETENQSRMDRVKSVLGR